MRASGSWCLCNNMLLNLRLRAGTVIQVTSRMNPNPEKRDGLGGDMVIDVTIRFVERCSQTVYDTWVQHQLCSAT